jgi:hypothetical protein
MQTIRRIDMARTNKAFLLAEKATTALLTRKKAPVQTKSLMSRPIKEAQGKIQRLKLQSPRS